MNSFSQEIIKYPELWETEYKKAGFVQEWRDENPTMFKDYGGSTKLGTLDLFPQYALMYLLRRDQGITSITWYKLADTSKKSKNRERTQRYWELMQQWMGQDDFELLQNCLRQEGFKTFTGEPDLFCWNSQTRKWFFAEAKGRDKLTESQLNWFRVCREALGDLADIRVYQLTSIKNG